MPTSSPRSLVITEVDQPPIARKAAKPVAKKTRQAAKPAPAATVPINTPTKSNPAKAKIAFKSAPKTKSVTAKPAAKKTPKKKAAKKTAPKKVAKKSAKKKTNPIPVVSAKPITRRELATIKREPLGHLLLEQKLREAGFRGVVSTDKELLEKYSTDESIFSIKPQIVIQPMDVKDVERAVKTVAAETKRFASLSLTPRAAGTGLSGGSLTDSVVIDVATHLNKVTAITDHKGEITITLEPGVMWRDMEKRLKERQVYVPSYPSSKDICTVGGSIANNAAGPDSVRYGHCADWVVSLEVVLSDGKTYTIEPLSHKEFKKRSQEDSAYGRCLKSIFAIFEKNEKIIKNSRPKTQKNSAGYALWDVISTSVADFKKGNGTIDLGRLISGSQGTIGIITSITLRTEPISQHTKLIAIPVFDLATASSVAMAALPHNPINIELFDSLTFDLALKNPSFFKDRVTGIAYYKMLLAMYTTYHVRWNRKTPEFTFLVTLDKETDPKPVLAALRAAGGTRARIVNNADETEMFWQIRRASYSLSKFQDPTKRPAAFLEDMTVPPEELSKFFMAIKKLFKKYNVQSAVHGHGGNGHFHFYPLLDFTKRSTADLVLKMADDFYSTAVKFHGNICGEHNDGIIRTPHLSKIFNKTTLELFRDVEHIFDPDDIFNPGKKVNPRFDIKESLRKTN